MPETLPFVGRKPELEKLATILKEASSKGQGRIVFLEGDVGMGKSFLLEEMEQQARRMANPINVQFASASCYEETGSQNAYQPFAEILDELYNATSDNTDIVY